VLLRFGIENHLSIRDRQELSLVSAKAIKDKDDHLIPCAASPSGFVVPVAVIYGANASGKSNWVDGFTFFRNSILYSQTRGEPGAPIARRPFLLDRAKQEDSTAFEATFTIGDVRYDYGFVADDTSFTEEWLYSTPKGRRVKLFERETGTFSFGRALRGQNAAIADLTRENSLFLSAAAQNSHDDLMQAYIYFQSARTDLTISASTIDLSELFSGGLDDRIVRFIGGLDTGICTYRCEESAEDDREKNMVESLYDAVSGVLTREFPKANTSALMQGFQQGYALSRLKIELGHKAESGSVIYLNISHESSGTRRLLLLLHHAFKALDQGSLLIVDELDTSLHTQACEAIIALFSSRDTNPKGAQLVATTHDTNLLRSPMLRRDQIWFTEKDEGGATHLYPLSDFKVRKEDNLEKGYLQGRFGAIPFAGSALALFGDRTHGA